MRVPNPRRLRTGALIIGAGAAGLRAAIELAAARVECLVVGKRRHGDAHTRWAAGGINASLGTRDPEDRWELHAADTLREGHFVCDPRAVELLAREAPARVRELAEWGCDFARTEHGELEQRYFGAQSFRRTCFVGDETGEAILRTLVRKADQLDVPWLERVYVVSLLKSDDRVTGAFAIDMDTGEPLVISAGHTLLAAGGHTSIYDRGSSRPDENTGDGVALALDAGALVRDMEFVQFHPTGWVEPSAMRGRLVTEAVRGEGGHLLNGRGERFMERYSPEQMELDARDVVARAIYREIREGRGTERGAVLLDISHRDSEYLAERLPHLVEEARQCGVDITREPLEVAPTAHYAMGGVLVDFATGATTVEGLFAAGEVTGGLHGANRLGGNSLAETVVYGRRMGAHLAGFGAHAPGSDPQPADWSAEAERLEQLRRTGTERAPELIAELRRLMWECAGIERDAAALEDGLRRLRQIRQRTLALQVGVDASLEELAAALDLRCMLTAGEAVLRSAATRTESRGAHYRSDHPEEVPGWRRTIVCRQQGGEVTLDTRDIGEPDAAVQEALAEERQLHYHHLE